MKEDSSRLVEQIRVLAGSFSEAEGLEIAVKRKKSLLLRVSDQTLEFQKDSEEYSILIRILKNNRLAQVVGADPSRAGLSQLFYQCVDLLRFSPERQKARNSIHPFEYNDRLTRLDLMDANLEIIEQREKVLRLLKLEERIRSYDAKIDVQSCFYHEVINELAHWTKGSHSTLSHRNSVIEIGAQVIAEQDGNIALASATDQQGQYYALDWQRVAERSSERALARLKALPVKEGVYDCIFSNRLARRMLSSFFEALRADLVLQDKSFLSSLLGQRIFSSKLSILDEPHMKGLSGSQFWDDEGTPTRRCTFVRQGRLINFAHKKATADEMQMAPTGHARLNFENASMGIGPNNLFLEPTHRDRVDLFSFADGGLYLVEPEAPISFSTVTGDFYLRARGYSIVDAKPHTAIHSAAIRGNFVDLFKRIKEVGRNLRWSQHYGAPSFMVESIRVEEAK